MPARPPYRSTLSNLLTGVTAGMNPMVALQQLASAQDQQMVYQEQLEAEREEKQAEKQQRFATLADMVFQGAASGQPLGAVEQQAEFLTGAMPGVGPRIAGRLEDLIGQAYPTQPAPFQDISPSIAVKGTEAEIGAARRGQGRPVETSPMYVPDPMEQLQLAEAQQELQGGDLPSLADVDVQIGTDPVNPAKPIMGPLQDVVAQMTNGAIRQGVPIQEFTQDALSALAEDGHPPEVLQAAQQQIEFMYMMNPPKPKPKPLSTGSASGTLNAMTGSAGLPLTNPIGGLR